MTSSSIWNFIASTGRLEGVRGGTSNVSWMCAIRSASKTTKPMNVSCVALSKYLQKRSTGVDLGIWLSLAGSPAKPSAYKVNEAICGDERYQPKVDVNNPDEARIAVSQPDYIPLRMRRVEQFSNAARAQELQTYCQHTSSADITDWADGCVYQRLKTSGYFTDSREFALQMSLDEITLTRVVNKRAICRLITQLGVKRSP